MIARVPLIYYFTVSVIIFLLSDALSVLFPTFLEFKISYFLKGSVFFFYLVLAIRILSIKNLFLTSFFVIIFATSQSYLFYVNKINFIGLIDNLRFFIWYFFGVILIFLFNKNDLDSIALNLLEKLNKVALLIITIVCISVLIGFIFNLEVLESYDGSRWGYKGILSKSITTSYFFIISLNYLYYDAVILKKKNFFFTLVLLCSLLTGTKSIYLFLLLLLFFDIISQKRYKLKSFWFVFITIVFLMVVFREKILKMTDFVTGLFYRLYQEKGLMYSLTSYRSEMLIDGINYYRSQWNWVNYLIGGRLIEIRYFEMSFFDLFYFFGSIGFLLFLYILIKHLIIPFFKKTAISGLFIICSVLLVAFFSGQFFNNSTVIILFFYFLLLIRLNSTYYEQDKHPKHLHS